VTREGVAGQTFCGLTWIGLEHPAHTKVTQGGGGLINGGLREHHSLRLGSPGYSKLVLSGVVAGIIILK